MKYEIKGGHLPYVICHLNKGQKIICEAGAMSWMTPGLTMDTDTSGGIGSAFKRALSGENFFQNVYTANEDSTIAFSSSFPGDILAYEVSEGKEIICQSHSFLASTENVTLVTYFNQRAKVGFFGGEGFIMQKIGGNGTVFIEVDGATEEYTLKENEKMVVSSGHLVMVDNTCTIDVQSVGNAKNSFLGGQGFFNTVVTGPGRIVLQSMPISKTADMLEMYLPTNDNH